MIQRTARTAIPLATLILLAVNLRPAITMVGPLLQQIRADTGISVAAAGLLSSLPLIAFGVFAPLARFDRRFGAERMAVAALLLLVLGTLVRSIGGSTELFGGSICLAAGIAIGNVLVPGIIKRDFPDRVKGLTTVYAVILGTCASLGSALAVPFAMWLPGGWRSALGLWAVPAAVALALWLPAARRSATDQAAEADAAPIAIWRSPLAWMVAAFMGLQSLVFYVAVSWFPTIFQGFGHSPTEAGLIIAVYQFVALIMSAVMPLILRRLRDQSAIACAASLTIPVAAAGLILAPGAVYLWMVILGMGGGVTLMLALGFIGMRSATHQEASSLSMLTQSFGYLLAATGPASFGLLHQIDGGWTSALILLGALGLVQAAVGYGAGRNRTIFAR